ncbi:hypothetical protein ACEZDB_03100 [Streptacidiphilus sp. N1-3]|uniref:Uncharacterized protein n=1 Tax=Streptacidiphilus alkalitolerans TaxID=3342712 RepID=A0ABV6WUL5_9ACTN
MDHRRGVATGPPEQLRARLLGAWDALLPLAGGLAPERLGALAELGSWPERPVLARLLAQAGGEEAGPEAARQDHARDGRDAVLAALERAGRRVAGALDAIEADPPLGLTVLESPLGPLPLLTQVHAMAHELALAAIGSGADPVPEAITDAGVAALVDVVGALAHRQGLRAAAGVWGPGSGGWSFRADPDGWETLGGPADVPGVEGAAATVLGVPNGRAALPSLLARGELRLHRIGGLMALAPLVEQVPGLPGGALLRRAVGAVGLLGRLPGMR